MRRYISITYDKIFKKLFEYSNNKDKCAYLIKIFNL